MALGLVAATLVGCGGGSNGFIDAYTGAYEGIFLGSNGAPGAVAFVVAPNGQIVSGTATTNASGTQSSLSGSVSNSGSATINIVNGGAVTDTLVGNLTAPTPNTVGAALTDTGGHSYGALIFNPTKFTGNDQFAGEFVGTITDVNKARIGVLALAVTGGGNVDGTALVDENGTSELAVLNGSISNNGTTSLVVAVNGTTIETITGTLSLAMVSSVQTISGNLKDSSSGDTIMIDATLALQP